MTNQQHPITPPPELRAQWRNNTPTNRDCGSLREGWLMDCAAQWGADQELEACCEWLRSQHHSDTWPSRIRAARRPNPPTLAEQATADLDDAVMRGDCITTTDAMPLLRAALARLAELEALPNDSH